MREISLAHKIPPPVEHRFSVISFREIVVRLLKHAIPPPEKDRFLEM